MNHDRIYEAYEGAMGDTMKETTKLRIEWICKNVHGTDILDVGCSQGICSILLGREHKNVTGLEIEADSINYARNMLSKEESSVRDCISFIEGDFLDKTLLKEASGFDTILMTEVLEHLEYPDAFIELAYEYLNDNGRFIVTVPFGINRHPDHKRTYYLTELHIALSQKFDIKEIEFHEGWIGFVADKTTLTENPSLPLDSKLFAQAEAIFYAKESYLLDWLKSESTSRAKFSAEAYNLKKSNDELNNVVTALKSNISNMENNITNLKAETTKLNRHISSYRQDIESLNKKYNNLASSKLGRIQITFWRIKKEEPTRIRVIIKCFSLVVKKISSRLFRKKKKVVKDSNKSTSTPVYDLNFIDSIKDKLEMIPSSSSGRYYKKCGLKVGILSDEFLYNTYKDVADCISMDPDKWREQIDDINMLFIITGWRGIHDEWVGFAKEGSPKRQIMYDIIAKCKENHISTVFYSIEDPPDYKTYLGIAQKCDYIFTTAHEMIPSYQKDCNNDNVNSLRFAINPLFHNPVGMKCAEKLRQVVFSGSWYEKFPERGKDTTIIFDGILNSKRGLKVFDRNLLLNKPQYKFPEKYFPYISPGVAHDLLQKVHKLFDWAVNINSVKESTTMFANRVYELEASGNLLISNYSVGVNSHLPVIYTVQDSDELTRIIDSSTDEEIYERQIIGIRHAMTGETCYDRFNEVLESAGLERFEQKRVVAVVFDELNDDIKRMFQNQTYINKELISVTELRDKMEQYDIIAFFNNSSEYSDFYLEDMINGFKFTSCDYITKSAYFSGKDLIKGDEHNFTDKISSKYRTVFWREAFNTADELLNLKDNTLCNNGYSSDHFNYNLTRVKTRPESKKKYKLSVILPVYNNGLHLYGKAFSSLRRNKMFEDMEILLIDDGSTDNITGSYVRYLENRYPNVRSYFFADGGSGSASRPRNKGVELATANYITYLDPDNEVINDAYTQLYNNAVAGKYDLVVGNMLKYTQKTDLANYYSYFKNLYKSDLVTGDKRDFIERIQFTPMSNQAMVVKKEVITKNALTQVVGAVGEDSLFSLQLFFNSKSIKAYDLPVHIYYAMVSGSTINSVNASYFSKILCLQSEQISWLKETNLLYAYMETRFNNYFKGWVLKKLIEASSDELSSCAKIVYEIFTVYKDVYNNKDAEINSFIKYAENENYSDAVESLKQYFSKSG